MKPINTPFQIVIITLLLYPVIASSSSITKTSIASDTVIDKSKTSGATAIKVSESEILSTTETEIALDKKATINDKVSITTKLDASAVHNLDNGLFEKNDELDIHKNTFRPPGYFWAALIIASLTLIWNVIQFFINKSAKREDKLDEIRDEYWLRTIAIPICVDPLIDFTNNYANEIKILNELDKSNISVYDKKITDFQNKFKDEKESTIKKFYVLSIKWNDVFSVFSETLDKLDDAVTLHCYYNLSTTKSDSKRIEENTIDEDIFYTILGEILNGLSDLHVYGKENPR